MFPTLYVSGQGNILTPYKNLEIKQGEGKEIVLAFFGPIASGCFNK